MLKLKSESAKSNKYKDDADRFREESLRAIRIRKVLPKFIFWILCAIAAIIMFVVFAIYFL